jgi:hypothetical protein
VKTKSVPTGMSEKRKTLRDKDWRKLSEYPFEESPKPNWRVNQAVRGALQRLSSTEREVVVRFHFCSKSCAEISAVLKIPEFRIYSILQEARRKLKEILTPFVQKRYGIPGETDNCRICRSENRTAIENLLKTKTKEETWKKVLRKLRTEFRIRANAQSLARHQREHRAKHAKKKPAGSTV